MRMEEESQSGRCEEGSEEMNGIEGSWIIESIQEFKEYKNHQYQSVRLV